MSKKRVKTFYKDPNAGLSHVAAILAGDGSIRVVVGSLKSIRHNVNPGDRSFLVPNFRVQEPVPYEQWEYVTTTATDRMKAVLESKNSCGACRQCCKTPHIAEIQKPSHTLCPLSSPLVGCTVHRSKPKSCAAFECLWLRSQKRNDRMPIELRPDRCGVYFTEDTNQFSGGTFNPLRIEAHEDRDSGVTNPVAVQKYVDEMTAAGYEFDKITFYHGEQK